MLGLERGEAADAGADHGADAFAVSLLEVEPGVVECLPAGVDAELGEAVGAANLLGRGKRLGSVELLHLAGDGAGEALGVEGGDGGDAALARGDVLPEVIDALAKRGDDTDAGDDDALSLRCVRHKAKQAAGPSAAELPGKSNSP